MRMLGLGKYKSGVMEVDTVLTEEAACWAVALK
jgi:hypothetical protein